MNEEFFGSVIDSFLKRKKELIENNRELWEDIFICDLLEHDSDDRKNHIQIEKGRKWELKEVRFGSYLNSDSIEIVCFYTIPYNPSFGPDFGRGAMQVSSICISAEELNDSVENLSEKYRNKKKDYLLKHQQSLYKKEIQKKRDEIALLKSQIHYMEELVETLKSKLLEE